MPTMITPRRGGVYGVGRSGNERVKTMNCPNCGGIKTIHAIDPITVPGEYACEICNHEFYGRNMRDAINNAKAGYEAESGDTAEPTIIPQKPEAKQ